ncbi:MAG: electron transfer flavoprotein subunit alpha/FixB family protein, partial [Candidatus Coatesbacteria bacterium]
MAKELWVVCEVKDGRVKRTAFEIIGKLDELRGGDYEVSAVVLGSDGEATAELNGYPVNTVYSVEAPALENYTTLGYTKALTDLINEKKPYAVRFGASIQGRDLSARTAARLGV